MIAIGRPIDGISLNGTEWLLCGNGEALKFANVEAAKEFLQNAGIADTEGFIFGEAE